MLISFPKLSIDNTDICEDFRLNIVKGDDGYKFRMKMEVDQKSEKKTDPGGEKKKVDLVVNHFHMSAVKLSMFLRGKELNTKTPFNVTIKFHISGGAPHLEGTIGGQEVDYKLDKAGYDKIISMFNNK